MGAHLSDAARDLCARWFGMSPQDSLRSHEPHAVLSTVRPAMDELVTAGIVTAAPFNKLGSVIFTGSDEACRIGRERLTERWAQMIAADLAPTHPEPRP